MQRRKFPARARRRLARAQRQNYDLSIGSVTVPLTRMTGFLSQTLSFLPSIYAGFIFFSELTKRFVVGCYH